MRIGIDAGGTFTDFVVLRDDGSLDSFKLRSSPLDPASVILAGIEQACVSEGTPRLDVVHGSTVATNALLERKGAATAFVTTAGFEDLIEIGRQNRRELYNLTPVLPRPLVLPEHRFGVAERLLFDGSVEQAPSASALRGLRSRLRAAGIESIAICLLHSYANPAHEKAVAEAVEGLGYVSASHAVSPEYREFERASTTVLNAYVGPLMDAYLSRLENQPVSILQSNGGFLSAAEARRQAVRTILSGPAGGVVGASEVGRAGGFAHVLGFDMGGTSTDVSLSDGAPRLTTEAVVDGFPIRLPMLDVHTVGAGGGSIARADEGGLLRVGPQSAGASPGPACYGVGDLATVTDAHVVLGRIGADQLLGGAMHLDVTRAEAAVARLASELDLGVVEAAEGILRVANANMERAIRVVSVEKGHDPRDFALVAFGGAGGLHACDLARELGIRTVLVPELAGMLSALGMLLADRVRDYSASALGLSDLETVYEELEAHARAHMPGCRLERSADLRYAGQSYELSVGWNRGRPATLFHREHERVYGYSDQQRPVEIVVLRVRAWLRPQKPRLAGSSARLGPRMSSRRKVRIDGAWRTVPVVSRSEVGGKLKGPALVIDYGSTTLLPGGWTARVDRARNLCLTRG